jgi:hypothetical protein
MSNNKYEHIGSRDDHVIEECAELIKALIKVKRFGWQNSYKGTMNVEKVVSEMNDVRKRINELEQWIRDTTPFERANVYAHTNRL